MSAGKARFIRKVVWDDSLGSEGDVAVTVGSKPGHVTMAKYLPRAELMRAGGLVNAFPKGGGSPLHMDNVQLLRYLREACQAGAKHVAPEDRTNEEPPPPTPPLDEPKDEPKVKSLSLDALVAKRIANRLDVDFQGQAHHHMAAALARLIVAGQHVYLPSVPGTGKSYMVKQVSDLLGYEFHAVNGHPALLPSDVGDYRSPITGEIFSGPLRKAADAAAAGRKVVLLFDEADNCNGAVVATFNSALANHWFAFTDGIVSWEPGNLVCVMAANTYGSGPTAEFVNRAALDAATLDRFSYLPIDIDEHLEGIIARNVDETIGPLWHDVVVSLRRGVAEVGVRRVFVTPRATERGAKGLAAGNYNVATAIVNEVCRGMSQETYDKVLKAANLTKYRMALPW